MQIIAKRFGARASGHLFALSGFSMWVLADTAIKLAGETRLPPYEIMACQGLLIAMFLAGLHAAQGRLRAVWPARPGRQMVRAMLDACNVFFVVVALRHLPLTLFYVLVFTAPMVIAVLEFLCLRERLSVPRMIAILAGFAGVVVSVHPGIRSAPASWTGVSACFICVLCFSASIVWSRVMARAERKTSMIFSSALMMAVTGFAGMAWHAAPLGPRAIVLLPVIAATVGLGNLFCFRALQSISAASLAQWHYSQLLFGSLLAWLIWHEVPGLPMVAGGCLIVGAGAYVASRGDIG